MERNEFTKRIKEGMQFIGIEIEEAQIEQFFQYMDLLIEWNQKMNLTAIIEPEEIILKHFIDSATCLSLLKEGKTIIDIGTGAGFPGIPIKILCPEKEIYLVDSLNKRIGFLDTVIQELQLKKIKTIHSRIEDLANQKEYREKMDIVVSRAVAPLNILLEYTLPFAKEKGIVLCMKGSNVEEEILNSEKALKILGGDIIEKTELILPKSDIKRSILKITKKNVTPKTYPRKAGTPSKNPIQ